MKISASADRELQLLADPTRARIVALIRDSEDGRALVGRMADALSVTQPTVSHHVRALHDQGVLERNPDGRRVWYSISAEHADRVEELLHGTAIASRSAAGVLDRISADLAARFIGTFGAETVDRYVRESYVLLATDERAPRYLASLTAQFAADRLTALATPTRGSSLTAAERLTDTAAPRDGVSRDGVSQDGAPQHVDLQHAAPQHGGTVGNSRAAAPRVLEVLFVCVQNAGRSQLAAGILRHLAGDRVRVRTAGSAPASSVRAVIVAALDEIGVPFGAEYPKPLTDEVVRAADIVITMGCGDACPVYPGRQYLDWEIEDPAGLPLGQVRGIRNDIDARVRSLLASLELNGG